MTFVFEKIIRQNYYLASLINFGYIFNLLIIFIKIRSYKNVLSKIIIYFIDLIFNVDFF